MSKSCVGKTEILECLECGEPLKRCDECKIPFQFNDVVFCLMNTHRCEKCGLRILERIYKNGYKYYALDAGYIPEEKETKGED